MQRIFKVTYAASAANGSRVEGTRTIKSKDEAQAAISIENRIHKERGDSVGRIEIERVEEVFLNDHNEEDVPTAGSVEEPEKEEKAVEEKQEQPEETVDDVIVPKIRTADFIAKVKQTGISNDFKNDRRILKVVLEVSGSDVALVQNAINKFGPADYVTVQMEATQKRIDECPELPPKKYKEDIKDDDGQLGIPGTDKGKKPEASDGGDGSASEHEEHDPEGGQELGEPGEEETVMDEPEEVGEETVDGALEESEETETTGEVPEDQPEPATGPAGPLTFQFFHVNGISEYWYSPDHDEWWLKSKDNDFMRTDEKDALENRKQSV